MAEKKVGAVSPEFTDALSRIDTALNNVASVVADLRGKIKTSMTAQEVSDATNTLGQIESRLKGIAADPDTPVPEPEPPVFAAKARR